MSFGFGFGLPRAPLRGRPLVAAIRSLFAANEPGVWYDPSDLSTLYQDSAGTTPVTAVEQPVGLMLDKSKGLVLGPELVTNGGLGVDANWTKGTTWTIASGKATANGGANFLQQYGLSWVVGKVYQVSYTLSDVTAGYVEARLSTGAKGKQRSTNGTFTETLAVTVSTDTIFNIIPTGFVGSIDNISVRELPGNHAYQTTATSRPVLSARYNLLTKTEQFDDAVWVKQDGFVATTPNAALAPNGTMTADLAAWSGFASLYQGLIGGVAGVIYVARVWVKGESGKTISVWFDTGTLSVNRQRYLLTGEWQEIVLQSTYNGTGEINLAVRKDNSLDTASEVLVWGADLRVANDGANLPPYQRVNTATDYDTVGFPHYLRFDGIDDWLVTNTITPGTDKVQVFAGVRKLSDAAHGTVVELGLDTSNTSSGSFCVLSPSSTITVGAQDFQSRGTVVSVARGVRLAPNTNILTGLGDISGDRATLRVNGTQAAQNTTDQGTGNYLAYPLYIGRRGGTSLPFNGHLYSLIVRFGSNLPTATIEKTEKYINTKTRAF